MYVKSTLSCFLELFFPEICVVCGTKLISQEVHLCASCQFRIPKTNFHLQPENPMEQIFYGRVLIERAAAFFAFQKGSDYQKILHRLKYKGQDQLGDFMGRLYGNTLINTNFVLTLDLILPVPLHPKKERKRGYNQSFHLAQGIGKALKLPVETSSVRRVVYSNTQTRKNRFERWQNVEGIFELIHPESLDGKHILLVDDVVTTGATFEACVAAIHEKCDAKISLLTLAIA